MSARAWLLGAALALLAQALPARSLAAPPAHADRPWDAPLADAPRTTPPDLTPEYTTLDEQGIRLVYHLGSRERAPAFMRRALAIRAELSAMLGQPVLANVEIRVASMPAYMQALAPPELPPGAPAAAFRDRHLVVMSLGGAVPQDMTDLEQELRHELAHLALDEALASHDVPRWFHEGFAIHASGEDGAARAEALCVAALRDRLLDLREVAARFPEGPTSGSIAAAEAAELVRFLADARPRFAALVRGVRDGRSFESALAAAYDGDLDQIERRFRKEVARRYSFVPVLAGATAVWVVVAVLVMVRRRRQAALRARAADERRALGAASQWGRERAQTPGTFGAATRLLVRDPPAPHLPGEDDDLAQAMPPDPEVPKVEHDGRWYTLH